MGGGHGVVTSLVIFFLCSVGTCVGSCIIAESSSARVRTLSSTFSVSDVPDPKCNTTLRQVFRLLDVNEDYVLIGSTECLYALTPNLTYDTSLEIDGPQGTSTCSSYNPAENVTFICKNYISHGFTNPSDRNSFTVCGTYDAANPRCWDCTKNGAVLNCSNGVSTENLATDPIQNVTAIMTEDGDQFFIGGRKSPNNFQRVEYQISRVDAAMRTQSLRNADVAQMINSNKQNVDFVGEPIQHGHFIYIFFRETALENYLQTATYSRIARVYKDDRGGETNPLTGSFTTFLKTRLMCSCGENFPVVYDEIQDIEAERDASGNVTFLYGVFTKRISPKTSDTAVCRYSMAEIEEVFNNALRRGPSVNDIDLNQNYLWKSIARMAGDEPTSRRDGLKYTYSGNLYKYLLNFPLLNVNIPNCGLGKVGECTDGDRVSHNALAVFQKIRGQQITVYAFSEQKITVYIGTNNREIIGANINQTCAFIFEDNYLNDDGTTEQYIDLKWPYGISSLRTYNGYIYGNTDNRVFRFQPDEKGVNATCPSPCPAPPPRCTNLNGLVFERRDLTLANHTMNITNAVTRFFTLFDAPIGTGMVPRFSELFSDSICSWKRFDSSANCKEILRVDCEITSTHIAKSSGDYCRNESYPTKGGTITIVNGNFCPVKEDGFKVTVDFGIDCSEVKNVDSNTVKEHDDRMAAFRFNQTQWLKTQTSSNTCPAASNCCRP